MCCNSFRVECDTACTVVFEYYNCIVLVKSAAAFCTPAN